MSNRPVHVEEKLKPGESVEKLIKRFLRKCKKSKVAEKAREKAYYKKPSKIRQEKRQQRERVLKKLQKEETEREQKLSGTYNKKKK